VIGDGPPTKNLFEDTTSGRMEGTDKIAKSYRTCSNRFVALEHLDAKGIGYQWRGSLDGAFYLTGDCS